MTRCCCRALVPLFLVLGLPAASGSAENQGRFFDQERYRLVREEGRYRVQSAAGSLEIPLHWLEPPEAVRQDEELYVGSLDWDGEVSSFPVGGGRLGLHLSSYSIAEGGSAQAANGRDLFLTLDPATGELERGLDLGITKSRVNVGGCWEASFARLEVGDVDCDRRLDLAVVEERMTCASPQEGGPSQEAAGGLRRPHHRLGPRRWYLGTGQEWVYRSDYDDRLPCAGMRPVPLIGLDKGPIEFLLEPYAVRSPLLNESGAPVWLEQVEPKP